ncbi:solute carrier family 23 protein [Lactobacillus sp. YT155]|uniref:uracil-xanthine permease family protein n=1 Tax=Lactobacillus sp. YT155 TaxID=3060955 RepID=UPI00265E9638|nr:solute carrier family 23 protein [Lactobacillus sp. YT155]MDO1605784.1 solute carrier family 23 protein [Lactobacillus sp. YT155]
MKNNNIVLDVHDKPAPLQWLGLSIQHLFAMFGSTVLVPILVGLNPGIALFSSGVGTLMHILVTKGKIPSYMSSSFAFITPMIALMKTVGYPAIAQGTIAVGVVYLIVATMVSFLGTGWIDKALPPIVVGPIIMVIGLSLAGNAGKDATMNNGHYDVRFFIVAFATLFITIAFNMLLKGFASQISILIGVFCGYIIAAMFGLVDFTAVINTPWFKTPDFEIPFVSYKPQIYWGAILGMAPIAFVTMTEHMGHIMVLDELTGKNFLKDPGLNRTLAGDGAASIVAGLIGGPSITSYGENIGVMAINKIYSVYVIIGAAVFAMIFGFVGKLSALIQSIPLPVIGGISFLLFGVIASSGLRILVDNQVDFNKNRNLMIASSVLVIGIGNVFLQIGTFQFSGVAVATIVGMLLNAVLPQNARNEQ